MTHATTQLGPGATARTVMVALRRVAMAASIEMAYPVEGFDPAAAMITMSFEKSTGGIDGGTSPF